MAWEVEQKFKVSDLALVRQDLTAIGAMWEEPISQADRYWNHPCRDFALTDEALRLRQVGPLNFITYKGPRLDLVTKTREELEFPLPDGPQTLEQIGQILAALGFRRVATVHKNRLPGSLLWEGESVHVALDEVAGVGKFAEIEVVVEAGDLERAKAIVSAVAAKCQLTTSERRSYLELLLEGLI